ncbi:Ferric siderophore transport system, periplasmic binding protein TonB [Dickeya solani RNS 08.23.3.1.A]|nr:Ferric siderophore transport system, periplasmic binding protein TonB [Dickeya solani RNS 08.23.3.1.A]
MIKNRQNRYLSFLVNRYLFYGPVFSLKPDPTDAQPRGYSLRQLS